ncbi:hypothetical protein KKG58_05795 [Patescibacteria group bacterium]|nr:hypothetical protein [Patescibacteria group bacterium]
MLNNPIKIRQLLKQWEQDKKVLISAMNFLDRIRLSKLQEIDLYKVFNDFFNKCVKFWVLCISTDSFQDFAQNYVEDLAQNQKIVSFGEYQALAQELSLSNKKTFPDKQRQDFYKIILRYYQAIKGLKKFKKTPIGFQNKLKEHAQKYFWLQNNYKREKILKSKYFWQQVLLVMKSKPRKMIEREIKDIENYENQIGSRKKIIIKKFDLNRQDKAFFKLANLWSHVQDEKKRINLISDHYIFSFAEEFAKRLKMPLNRFCYLTLEEIKKGLLYGKQVTIKKIQNRMIQGVFITTPSKGEWVIPKAAKQIWQSLFLFNKIKELKGLVACRGEKTKLRGLVQIVLDPENVKFKKGRILVTSMTRPDFVPLMKKVKAIVANEGGLTSHAAIISREFNIPCIIGTQVATQFLKDNDLVEIDASAGVVRKLSKK